MSTHEVKIPKGAQGDPDLPAKVQFAKVFIGEGTVTVERARGGLPRSLRDLAGNVRSAKWADDATMEVEVRWASLDGAQDMRLPGAGFAGQLVAEGLAELAWDGRAVLVVPVRG